MNSVDCDVACPDSETCQTAGLQVLGWVAFAVLVLVIAIIGCKAKTRQRSNEARTRNLEQANMHQAEEQVRIANGLPYYEGINNRADSDLSGAAPAAPVYGTPGDFTKSSEYEIGEIP